MVNFICSSLSCIQMYLGAGYTILQTENQILYYNFQRIYVCTKSSYFFSCKSVRKITDGTNQNFFVENYKSAHQQLRGQFEEQNHM